MGNKCAEKYFLYVFVYFYYNYVYVYFYYKIILKIIIFFLNK